MRTLFTLQGKCYATGEIVEGTEQDEHPQPVLFTTNGIVNGKVSIKTETRKELIPFEEYFPILRPFSDLTKEIEVDGERFIPMMKILELNGRPNRNINRCKVDGGFIYELSYHYGQEVEGEKNVSWQISVPISQTVVSLTTANMLFKWGFDVFRMIEDKLAYDINLIEEKR